MATTSTSISSILIAFQPNNINHPKLQRPSLLPLSQNTKRKPTSTITCNAINPNTTSSNESSLSSTITIEQPAQLQPQPQQPRPQRPSPPKLHQTNITSVWRKLHGEDNWAGLLEPLDTRMRTELIRYGEMAQACYDSFDFDPYSKYCGNCRYTHDQLFEALDMTHLGYQVTRYLFATANISLPSFFKRSRWPHKMWSERANWAGYIAVSNEEMSRKLGRRDIVIVWRGTITHVEWVADLEDYLRRVSPHIPCPDKNVKVESGFLDLYTDKEPRCRFGKLSARDQVLAEVDRLMEEYGHEEVSITTTGHSLGSAFATLSAYDIAEMGLNRKNDGSSAHVSAITFAGPRVGNLRFKERLESVLGVKVLRVVNKRDVVPKAPGVIINENRSSWINKIAQNFPWSYHHVGVELELDHLKSNELNHDAGLSCAHNLEAYLHMLDGYHGSKLPYKSVTGRDIALVNKSCDFVIDEHSVPPVWWQDLNKGLVKGPDGLWRQPERPGFEDYPEDTVRRLKKLGIA